MWPIPTPLWRIVLSPTAYHGLHQYHCGPLYCLPLHNVANIHTIVVHGGLHQCHCGPSSCLPQTIVAYTYNIVAYTYTIVVHCPIYHCQLWLIPIPLSCLPWPTPIPLWSIVLSTMSTMAHTYTIVAHCPIYHCQFGPMRIPLWSIVQSLTALCGLYVSHCGPLSCLPRSIVAYTYMIMVNCPVSHGPLWPTPIPLWSIVLSTIANCGQYIYHCGSMSCHLQPTVVYMHTIVVHCPVCHDPLWPTPI